MSRFTHLSFDELKRYIIIHDARDTPMTERQEELLREWFLRTQHVREQVAREAARAAS